MALYIDSAYLDEVSHVCASYPIAGVTTNPSILAAAVDRGQRLGEMDVLRALLESAPGTIFMQPTAAEPEGLRAGAMRYLDMDPRRVVPKLPMTAAGLQAATALKRDGARIAFTAVYTLPQAYCATMAGADWIIPYFGRLRRAGIDACQRIEHMARLLVAQSATARLLAASVKSPDELIEATLAGAHDITAQPSVILGLAEDPLTAAAIAQFAADHTRMQVALR